MAEAVPRLYLITPPLAEAADFAPLLETAIEAGDIACVLVRLANVAASEIKKIMRHIAPIVQKHDAALLVEDPLVAARCDADGVHVGGLGDALAAALAAMKPEKIVGVGGLTGRHEAMLAGESGVDYVMFGETQHLEVALTLERIAWWAEIFTISCVGYAPSLEDVGPIAAAGADFVALGDAVWQHEEGPAAAVEAAMAALACEPEHEPAP